MNFLSFFILLPSSHVDARVINLESIFRVLVDVVAGV